MRPSLDNFKSPAALSRFALVTVVGLVIDLWTKALAVRHLAATDRKIQFIPGWLRFEYTENRGAVFGLGQGQQWLFVSVSLVAIVFLSWLFATSERRQRVYQVLLGLLLAGVLGNMYDRITLGHVRDMIHALPEWRWPGTWQVPLLNYPEAGSRAVFPFIFNVADAMLCTGVFLMIVYSLFHAPHHEKSEPRSHEEHEAVAGSPEHVARGTHQA